MRYREIYITPDNFSDIELFSDGEFLTGLNFLVSGKESYACEKKAEVFSETRKWLDLYFDGKNPDFLPKYKFPPGTPFMLEVWSLLEQIPYGRLTTYGEIAKIIAGKRGLKQMSAQAVGSAVSKNPIGIIVPCHRVVGKNGKLVGYAGGINNKFELLKSEGSYPFPTMRV